MKTPFKSNLSEKRSKMVSEYHKRRKTFLERFKMCQVKSRVCTGMASEVHHSKGRIGNFLIDESTFVAICSACHRWIEQTGEGVKWAKENGFIKTRI